MDVRTENRGRPHQKVRFPAAPVAGRNFLTPGHSGVRVRNVRGKSGPKSLCLCCFSSPIKEQEPKELKKPLTHVSKRVPGAHGKRGLESKGLAKGWQRVSEGLAQGWRRVSGFPCTLQFRNSRGARVETWVNGFLGNPPVLKILRRVNVGTGRKVGTDVAQRYGEGSEMLVFLGERGRKMVEAMKNYTAVPTTLRIRAPYYFSYGGVLWEAVTVMIITF